MRPQLWNRGGRNSAPRHIPACSLLLCSCLRVEFRVREIILCLLAHLGEQHQQGDHVGDNHKTHCQVLDGPHQIDLLDGAHDAEEGVDVLDLGRQGGAECVCKALGRVKNLYSQPSDAVRPGLFPPCRVKKPCNTPSIAAVFCLAGRENPLSCLHHPVMNTGS